MTYDEARRRLEQATRFENGRPVWDARDREAVHAVFAKVKELEELLLTMLSKVNRDEIYKHDLVALAMDGAVATDGCHTDVGSKVRAMLAGR
jgi:hypothetical protein